MSKKALSAKAAMVKGAVLAHFGPRFAADGMPKLNTVLKDVRQATWAKQKANVIAEVVKLAKDATASELVDVLGKMDEAKGADEDDDELNDEFPPKKEGEDPDKKPDMVPDADNGMAEICTMLKALLAKLGGGAAAEDEPAQTANAAEANPKGEANKEPVVEKKAMDAAIKLAEDRTVTRMNAIYAAEKDVKPYVGKIKTAMDSAEKVYKFALDSLKIDVKDVPPSAAAYRAVLLAQPKPGEDKPRSIAADQASTLPDNVAELFPDMHRHG